jgi:hypothetical protein
MWTNSSGSATTLAQFIGFTPTIAGGSACVSVTATGAGTCGLAQSGTSWFTFSVTTNAWHHYVFEVTSAAAGTAKLTVDGTVVGTFSGDTRGGSGSTFVSTVFVVGVNIGPSPPAEFYIDDLSVYSGVNTPVITQDARVMVLA